MKYIYIAGPYTNPDPVINTRSAIEAGDIVAELGYYPYTSHLTLFWNLVAPHKISFWYQHDLAWLEKCDALIRLPGTSSGADKEVDYATELKIPVFFGLESFMKGRKDA